MQVTEFSKLLNTTPDTVRYYTRIRLLTPTKSPENGYKVYGKKDRQRLKFILSARQLDFSVEDIKDILSVTDKGHTACPIVRELIERRIENSEKQFEDAITLRKRLQAAIQDWHNKPDKAPTGDMICHLIEGVYDE